MPQVAFASRLCKRFSIDCFVKTPNCLENLPWHLPHDKINKVVCTPSEDSDQSGHPLSARRKLCSLSTHWVHSEDSDQTGQMLGLNRVFAGHTVIFLVLSWGGSFFLQKLTIREVLCSSFKLLSSCSFTSVAVTLFITASAKSWAEQTIPFLVEY